MSYCLLLWFFLVDEVTSTTESYIVHTAAKFWIWIQIKIFNFIILTLTIDLIFIAMHYEVLYIKK
jgi:hypothetical protein